MAKKRTDQLTKTTRRKQVDQCRQLFPDLLDEALDSGPESAKINKRTTLAKATKITRRTKASPEKQTLTMDPSILWYCDPKVVRKSCLDIQRREREAAKLSPSKRSQIKIPKRKPSYQPIPDEYLRPMIQKLRLDSKDAEELYVAGLLARFANEWDEVLHRLDHAEKTQGFGNLREALAEAICNFILDK